MKSEESIAAYYEEDHDRLEGLFRQFQQEKSRDFDKAKQFFKEFKFGLQRHIVWEEEILFPVFEAKSGMRDTGPTAVMRFEHRQIKEALEAVHGKVKEHDPNSDREENVLLAVLGDHNGKEESILYPMIDRVTSGEEKKEISQRMKSIPEEKYQACCGHDVGLSG